MQHPGQNLFAAILKVAKATIKPNYSDSGVDLQWDLENFELRGSFLLPLKTEIDAETGEYIVTSQDFTEPEQTP